MSTPDERPVRQSAGWTAPQWDPPEAEVIDLRDDSGQHGPGGGPDQQPTPWDMSWATDDEPAEPTDAESADSDAPAGSGAHSGADRPDPLTDPLEDAKRTSLLGLEDGPDLDASELELGGPTGAEAADHPPWERGENQPTVVARHSSPAAPAHRDPVVADPVVADPAIAAAMQPVRRRDGEATWTSGSRTVPVDGRRVGADDLRTRRSDAPPQRRLRARLGRRDVTTSPALQRERDLTARLRTPLPYGHRLAVVSLKGGVGKTTATAVLGATLATLRTDRIVAIDANPDRGTLAEKIERTTDATVRDLIHAGDRLGRYTTVQTYINQTESRLEVLASESDPGASHALDESDYAKALEVLERYYNVILTDCGTGLLHAATRAALSNADSVVVVSSSSLDGARSASATLDWLEAHGREDLSKSAVAIVNEVRPGVDPDDVRQIEEHFAARCRAVERVPYDPHLATGDVISLDELMPQTRAAFVRIAATVVSGAAVDPTPTR